MTQTDHDAERTDTEGTDAKEIDARDERAAADDATTPPPTGERPLSGLTAGGSRRDFLKLTAGAGALALGASAPAAAAQEVCGNDNGSIVVNDDFTLLMNQWGQPEAQQCIRLNDDGSYGYDFDATGLDPGAINYPEVFIGTRPWGSDTGVAEFPLQRNNVDELVIEVEADYTHSGGEWDWAEEWWLLEQPVSQQPETHQYEIMLLLDWSADHSHGAVTEEAAWTDQFGNTVDHWVTYNSGGTSATFFIFRIQGGHDGGRIDLQEIVDFLTANHGVAEDLWISGIELGNEYWGGATGETTYDTFDVSVNGSTYTSGSSGGGGDTTAPTEPSNVSVAGTTSASIDVDWNASSDSGGSGLDGYNVYVDGSLDHSVAAGTTSTTISNLSAGTSYQVGVAAVDGAGNESGQTTVTATTQDSSDTTAPTAPSNLSVSSTTSSSVGVGWDASTDTGGSGLDHYNVAVDGTLDHTVAAGTTSTTVSGLSADTSYSIGVSAVDGAGNQSVQATVSATTDADGGGTGDALVVHEFEAGNYPGSNDLGNWADGDSLQNGAGTISGGALRLEYDDSGWFGSNVSQSVADRPTLNLRIRGDSGGEEGDFTVEVGGASDVLANVTSDTIGTSYSTVSVDLSALGADLQTPQAVRLNFWQGAAGAVEIDRIAFGGDGGGGGDQEAPTTPANLTSPGQTASAVDLDWDASSDTGGSGLDSYDVYVDGSLDHSVAAGTSSTTVSGLTASTSYQFAVSAVDGAGNESAQATVSATTAAGGDQDAPTTPSNLSVTGTTSSSIDVDWDAASDSGGSGLDHYAVYVDGSRDHTVAAGTTSTTVSGLSADTSYQVGVSAIDGAGNESSTTTVSATTATDGGGTDDALLVNDYDGSPTWPGQNDLGNWNGAGSLVNGDGAVTSGELVLQYDNAGWAQERVDQDVSAYADLVFVIRGASGGEGQHFTVGLGGATSTFADVADSAITTTSSEVRVDMQAAGIDRTSPAELQLDFWQGGSGASTIYVEEIRFE